MTFLIPEKWIITAKETSLLCGLHIEDSKENPKVS
jgi:hypothetical protein